MSKRPAVDKLPKKGVCRSQHSTNRRPTCRRAAVRHPLIIGSHQIERTRRTGRAPTGQVRCVIPIRSRREPTSPKSAACLTLSGPRKPGAAAQHRAAAQVRPSSSIVSHRIQRGTIGRRQPEPATGSTRSTPRVLELNDDSSPYHPGGHPGRLLARFKSSRAATPEPRNPVRNHECCTRNPWLPGTSIRSRLSSP